MVCLITYSTSIKLKQILPEPKRSQLLTILSRPQELENDKVDNHVMRSFCDAITMRSTEDKTRSLGGV